MTSLSDDENYELPNEGDEEEDEDDEMLLDKLPGGAIWWTDWNRLFPQLPYHYATLLRVAQKVSSIQKSIRRKYSSLCRKNGTRSMDLESLFQSQQTISRDITNQAQLYKEQLMELIKEPVQNQSLTNS
ncbi:unnamed protein product, partial [Rotaria magnacalcarata]